MMTSNPYYDRRTGRLCVDPVYAARFLDWSYNSAIGRWATVILFRQRFVSRFYGWFHKLHWSRRKIGTFIERMSVDMAESLRPIEDFVSFNDFFTREIDLSRRPIDSDTSACVAPTDGRILAYPLIDGASSFRIKGSVFDLRGLLRDDELAARYSGGSLVISRLYLSDYHHFHFPDCGSPAPARCIPGKYFAVGPYARTRPVPFYTENARALTLFESDHFGTIVLVEIGAFTVGSIRQLYRPGVRVAKGDRKGLFEIGGSTVALLFQHGAIEIDADLCANTKSGFETYVRLGEVIGRSPVDGMRRGSEDA